MDRPLIVVTGASRGIGRAVVDALLARDCDVIGVARSPVEPDPGPGFRQLTLDLADLGAVRAAFADLADRCAGRARVGLVDNAARLDVGPQTDLELEAIAATLTVNVAVPMWLAARTVAAAPTTAAVRIVDLSSGAAFRAYPGWSTYCASKAALDMAGQVLAAEVEAMPGLAGRDIAVLGFAPGVVATAMQAQIRATPADRFPDRQRFVDLHARGALVEPTGPAAAIADWIVDADGAPQQRFTRARHG